MGDILLAAGSKDFATADRLGREYSDELLLVCDDLGWGATPETDLIELDVPPEFLLRLFASLREAATSEREAQAGGWDESRELDDRNRIIEEASRTILWMLWKRTRGTDEALAARSTAADQPASDHQR